MAATSHIKGADSNAPRVTSFGLATRSLFWKILQSRRSQQQSRLLANEKSTQRFSFLKSKISWYLRPLGFLLAWLKQINACWEKVTRRQFRFGPIDGELAGMREFIEKHIRAGL